MSADAVVITGEIARQLAVARSRISAITHRSAARRERPMNAPPSLTHSPRSG
jgi:hypothetical protein